MPENSQASGVHTGMVVPTVALEEAVVVRDVGLRLSALLSVASGLLDDRLLVLRLGLQIALCWFLLQVKCLGMPSC